MRSTFGKELDDFEYSAIDKKYIALGILHNIIGGIDKLEVYISNPSNPRIQMISALLQSNQFLYAHVFELCMKSIWELSHSKIFTKEEFDKYNHNIYKLYLTLDINTQTFIEQIYNSRAKEFNDLFKNSDLYVLVDGSNKIALSSFSCYSFKECLQLNRKIVTEGKYKFREENKLNIVTGISHLLNTIHILNANSDALTISMEPSEFLYDIIKYIEKIMMHGPRVSRVSGFLDNLDNLDVEFK